MISVRRIRLGESELFKQVRLASLRDSPFAFSATYESALQRSPESWRAQAEASAEGSDRATFIAFSGETPVGIMAIYRDQERADTGEVLQVWVAPEQRGAGVAESLMEAIIGWAKGNGFRRILAGITPGNARALRFYQKYGFTSARERAPDLPGHLLEKEIEFEQTP